MNARHLARVLAPLVLVVVAVLVAPGPAGAQVQVVARGATLSTSASCAQGDIEIEYGGTGVDRQVTTFTAEDGRELHRYDVDAYAANHDGVEYILSQTRQPPAPGTLVAVHVTIGSSPADATTAEFFVGYTCDAAPNDQGGTNEVVYTCFGAAGTCPTTAQELANAARAVRVNPTFTG